MAEVYLREAEVGLLIERWHCASSPSSVGGAMQVLSSLGQLVQTGHQRTRGIDATAIERTDRALAAMTLETRTALTIYHTSSNSSLREMGRVLRCGKDAAKQRIAVAHELFWHGYENARFNAAEVERKYKETASKPAPRLAIVKNPS